MLRCSIGCRKHTIRIAEKSRRGGPTRRTADGGYAPRFLGIWLALGFSHFDDESTFRPPAFIRVLRKPLACLILKGE